MNKNQKPANVNRTLGKFGEEKELAQLTVRLADLCQYFSREGMGLPVELFEQITRLPKLAIPERIRSLKEINTSLMEYLNDAGKGPSIRQ